MEYIKSTSKTIKIRLFFALQLRPTLRKLCFRFRRKIRELRIDVAQRLYKDFRDEIPRIPLLIGRNNIPRAVFRRGIVDHIFERSLILVPESTLLYVVRAELPVLFLTVNAFDKAFLLFVF